MWSKWLNTDEEVRHADMLLFMHICKTVFMYMSVCTHTMCVRFSCGWCAKSKVWLLSLRHWVKWAVRGADMHLVPASIPINNSVSHTHTHHCLHPAWFSLALVHLEATKYQLLPHLSSALKPCAELLKCNSPVNTHILWVNSSTTLYLCTYRRQSNPTI